MPTLSCVLIGHKHTHEVQVIAQIFFPNARFEFIYGKDGKEDYPLSRVVSRLVGMDCTGELHRDGKIIATHTLTAPCPDTLKRTLMLSLFHALKEATEIPTPWGALTGVRPAKRVRNWLEEGISEAIIVERLRDLYQCRDDKIQLALAVAKAEQSLITKHLDNYPVGLYIGIPFCSSRCLYCSFVTAHTKITNNGVADIEKSYIQALSLECKHLATIFANQPNQKINTVYIGGGTPTALSEENLATLLEMVQYNFAPFLTSDSEYTVEAGRPDSITPAKLSLLKTYKVNRIAINPQTMSDETLQRIGRAHTAHDFYTAYEMAQKAGFTNINTDIIVGLPGESLQHVQQTMAALSSLSPAHITVHTLAVKRASRLNEHLMDYPLEDFKTVDTMLRIAHKTCTEELGLAPYYMYRQKNMTGHFENVGYSLPGHESIYNIAMMAETQTVYAAGAGAVTKTLTETAEGILIERVFNPKNVEIYIERMMEKYEHTSP